MKALGLAAEALFCVTRDSGYRSRAGDNIGKTPGILHASGLRAIGSWLWALGSGVTSARSLPRAQSQELRAYPYVINPLPNDQSSFDTSTRQIRMSSGRTSASRPRRRAISA